MGILILLLIIYLIWEFIIKDIIVVSIIGGIALLILVIWKVRKSQTRTENLVEVKKYDHIEMRPLARNASGNSPSKASYSSYSTTARQNYETIHRPKDEFQDNMNYKVYKCKGVYVQTNRRRTVTIEAFDKNDAMEQLRQSGFVEPYEIVRIPFPKVTDPQREALGNVSLFDVCKYDASAILSCRYDKDSIPNPELVTYATECHIKFSYYIGKRALYDLIFYSLALKDKIAFFCFCVYRYTTADRAGNLNNHQYRNIFYRFAADNVSNKRFITSMNKYAGNELRFFGKLTVHGAKLQGGSTQTVAYKTAIEFLSKHFSLANVSSKSI